jgi:predicted nucleotidyltransferase
MLPAVLDLIQQNRAALTDACRRFEVARLDLFGSAVTGMFDPAASDVDFLVVFQGTGKVNAVDRYFGLLSELENLFGRKVDLIDVRAHRNPYFMAEALKHREMLYAA